MGFKENIVDDIEKVFLNEDEFAEEVSYKCGDDVAKTILAIVNRDLFQIEKEPTGQIYRRDGTIFISTDATEGIANPSYVDTVTIDTEVWSVITVARKDGGMVEIGIVRLETVEKGKKEIE